MPTVPEDVNLVSSWEEVDAAAQAIANGLQKSQMAQSVQASLGKADAALQGSTGLAQLGEGRAVCNTAAATAAKVATVQGSGTFALREGSLLVCYFTNAVPAGATLDVSSSGAKGIYYNNTAIKDGMIAGATYALLQYNGTSDKWVLIVTSTGPIWACMQPQRTADMTAKVGYDLVTGQLFAETGLLDEAKRALLNLLQNVVYTVPTAQDDYDELERGLFPPGVVLSISAVFAQGSTVVYDTDSLDDLRSMLTVTATYDDGTTATVTGYTLSGTLTAGTSTITVSYYGKTTTFDVTVTSAVLFQVKNKTVDKSSNACVDTGLDLLSTDRDFTILFDGTQPSAIATGSNVRLMVCWSSGTSYKGIFVGAGSSGTSYNPQWYSAEIPSADRVLLRNASNARFRIVYYHKAGESKATVIQKLNNGTPVTSVLSSAFIAQEGHLFFGGITTSANTQNWVGTINEATVYSKVLTQDQIDSFLA